MRNRFKKVLSILVLLQGLNFLFTNCSSDVEFSSGTLDKVGSNATQTADSNANSDPGNSIDDNSETPPPITNGPPPPSTDGQPNLNVVFDCTNYEEITADSVIIPNRDGSGLCYYLKLMDATASHSSGTYGEGYDDSVLARKHSSHHGFTGENAPPLVLGDRQLNLQLGTDWKLALSGDPEDPTADMYIDNFFLIDVTTSVNQYFWAYGTADAEPKGGRILAGNADVPVTNFYSFAPGGTASVSAIEFTSSVPVGQNFDLRFRALDCGGSATSSDVYLVIY